MNEGLGSVPASPGAGTHRSNTLKNEPSAAAYSPGDQQTSLGDSSFPVQLKFNEKASSEAVRASVDSLDVEPGDLTDRSPSAGASSMLREEPRQLDNVSNPAPKSPAPAKTTSSIRDQGYREDRRYFRCLEAAGTLAFSCTVVGGMVAGSPTPSAGLFLLGVGAISAVAGAGFFLVDFCKMRSLGLKTDGTSSRK